MRSQLVARGFAGLAEGERAGRPRRLNEEQMDKIEQVLRKTPAEAGMADGGVWDGKTLSAFLKQAFALTLQVRQCQRFFRQIQTS